MSGSAKYLTADQVWAMNARVLGSQGAAPVLRDRAALESAVARAQMRAHYEGADLIDQAVSLILGLALAHPFLDGNKRTAALAGDAFLRLNGLQINPDGIRLGEELLDVVETVGDRSLAEATFSAWLRSHVLPIQF